MASKGLMFAGAALALAAGIAVAPGQALAQRARGVAVGGGGRVVVAGGGRVFVGGAPRVVVSGGGRAIVTRPGFVHHPFIHRPFIHRPFIHPFFPFGVVAAAPAFAYAAPAYYPPPAYYSAPYYDPPSYADPVTYSPPATYAPAPSSTVSVAPAPQAPTVVQFATGRYELRGDGVTSPYMWVWIPNPPASPPPTPPAEPGASSGKAPARMGHLYRWTDDQGVVYWTDRLDAVPEQYRSRAKQTTSS